MNGIQSALEVVMKTISLDMSRYLAALTAVPLDRDSSGIAAETAFNDCDGMLDAGMSLALFETLVSEMSVPMYDAG